jgi:hypothetical protein
MSPVVAVSLLGSTAGAQGARNIAAARHAP